MRMNKRFAIIRSDGSAEIGMGHLMRCSVLAEELIARGWEVLFLTRRYDGTGVRFLESRNYPMFTIASETSLEQDCSDTCALIQSRSATIVITDSYKFDDVFFRKLKESGVISLNIDDLAEVEQASDFVLNQNASATLMKYRCVEGTQLFLGTQYALIRRELRDARLGISPISEVTKHFLITVGGGSDQGDVTRLLLNAVGHIDGSSADIVIGAGHSRKKSLESLCADSSGKWILHVATDNMGKLMARADIMISAGGTTSWERCCLGVPGFCIVLAKDQEPNVRYLDKIGAAVSLGMESKLSIGVVVSAIRLLVNDTTKRRRMRDTGMGLVDGKGVYRIIDSLEERLVS